MTQNTHHVATGSAIVVLRWVDTFEALFLATGKRRGLRAFTTASLARLCVVTLETRVSRDQEAC